MDELRAHVSLGPRILKWRDFKAMMKAVDEAGNWAGEGMACFIAFRLRRISLSVPYPEPDAERGMTFPARTSEPR